MRSRSPVRSGHELGLGISLVVYVAGVGLCTGLASVPLFDALRALGFAPEFHKLTLRTAELSALAGALLWLRLRGVGLAGWGLGGPLRTQLREGLLGLALGAATIGAVFVLALALGARELRPEASLAALPASLAAGLLVGLAVALLEELWLRGGLLAALGPDPWRALWLTSAVYALVHFVRADQPVAADAVRWWSGFAVVAGSFDRLADPRIVDSFLALFAAGVLLARLRLGCGRLAVCVGVHAGWVAGIRATRDLTTVEPAGPGAWLVGSYDTVVGWLAVAVFGLGAFAAHRILPPPGRGWGHAR